MTKIIVVEGPDNSGKTTLGKELSEFLRIPLVHSGGPPKNKESFLERLKGDLQYGTVVWDRHPLISEPIYGPMLRGYDTSEGIDKHPFFENALVIYCSAPFGWMMKLENQTVGDYHGDEDHHKLLSERAAKICHRYEEVMADTPHVPYNFMKDSHDYLNLLLLYARKHLS